MIKEKSRECRVWVTSHQVNTEGEKQVMKTENKGRLSEREGVLYVLYEEKTEEGEVVKKSAENRKRTSPCQPEKIRCGFLENGL